MRIPKKSSDYCWCTHQVKWHSQVKNQAPFQQEKLYKCRWCDKRFGSEDGHFMSSDMPIGMKIEAADKIGESLEPIPVKRE